MEASFNYQFYEVQDLTQMEAVVFDGTAYPLDGGEPHPVDMTGVPASFRLPLMESEIPGGSTVPARALCEGLGAEFSWDEAASTAVMTFRGVTLEFTVGETAYLANGEALSLSEAPALRDGVLTVGWPVFWAHWKVLFEWAQEDFWADTEAPAQFVAWVVIP